MKVYQIKTDDCMGFVRPYADAHTLGPSSLASLLEECGIKSCIADFAVCQEIEKLETTGRLDVFASWIRKEKVTILGFSYRLDPETGLRLFSSFFERLRLNRQLARDGGPLRALYFAGLPKTCEMISEAFPGLAACFQGDESPSECLALLGIDSRRIPSGMRAGTAYDESRMQFAKKMIAAQEYRSIKPVKRDYPGFGSSTDSLSARVADGRCKGLPPLMRAHVGPFSGNPTEDFRQFREWTRELASAGLLDVLSIGTSQLTQSRFYDDRQGMVDGGGISIHDPEQYQTLWEDARPMLVRTYAGTRNIVSLAALHEKTMNIAWHALSFWWFCKLDGRGPHDLNQNLKEHFETMKYAALTGKPLEPNVPHHFAFRGADDVSYVVSGYLAAKAAKKNGIRILVLQVMLNTPKYTWGIQDLAKARALCELVRSLEDKDFRVLLQPRGGLDYFSPDLEKAKVQLAAVSAMMTDIDATDSSSPPLIHVVSYSEAVRLADPSIINESIQITRQALVEYRKMKSRGLIEDVSTNPELLQRTARLQGEARLVIKTIEELIPDPYSPHGFEEIFRRGFLPVPWLWEGREQYPHAVAWQTRLVDGGVWVVDGQGKPLSVDARMELLRSNWQGEANDARI